MPVRFENFDFSFTRKGKPVFKPSDRGKALGQSLKEEVEKAVDFDPFYYHLRVGGHVGALHAHRPHRWFARLDIERFFYCIGRNRVATALAKVGISKAGYRAKWSCVRNPYDDPRYALPYGFVQSPILATLVLMNSAVGEYLRNLPSTITSSVYMDDITLSGDDETLLDTAFHELCDVVIQSNFLINHEKSSTPSSALKLFNCDLIHQVAVVRDDRRALFFEKPRSAASCLAFQQYCDRVEKGNSSS